MKMVSYRSILDERLGPARISIVEDLEPLFQEAIHDTDIQTALLRGELPPAADGLQSETRRWLQGVIPASLEEIADLVMDWEQAAA